jgi:hypothetical protein
VVLCWCFGWNRPFDCNLASSLPLLPVVIVVAVYCCYFIHSFGTFFCIRPWDWSCLLNGLLLYSPFCCCNLDPYFMLRAFVSIDSINLKFFLTVAFYYLLQPSFANIILSLFILSDWGSFCFGALIYLFFFRIGILFTACSVSSSTNGIISFLSTTVCLLNRPCPRSQISMPHPITKNCIPKCRLLGTRPVSV